MRARLPLLFLVLAACDVDYERMLDQEKYEAYEPNPFFEDGKTLQRAPEHTVAVDAIVGRPALVHGIEGNRYVASFPIPITGEVIARGANRFGIFCATCHGLLGDGESEVAENMKLAPPPSLLSERVRAFPPGRLYAIAARGYGLMPSYAEELSIADRWAVVAYVQVLQLSQRLDVKSLPAPIRAGIEEELP